MFEEAIELDPDFASAYVGLGRTYQGQTSYGCTEFPSQTLKPAKDLALKALNLGESHSEAYALLGLVYTFWGRYDLAINQLNRAIELNPNDAFSLLIITVLFFGIRLIEPKLFKDFARQD
jgi:tetratricopeptide (TPR) repeat protein